MAYEKHNFKSGEKLYAHQLNEMEEQIVENEAAAKNAANKTVSWDELTDKPFGMEVTETMSLFASGVPFEGKQYAITEPFPGPLILGGIYSLRVKQYNSSTATNYTGLTATQRVYNGKDYFIVGDLNCVPGLSDPEDPAPIAFVIDPDNKPDENGVYGWIFTDLTYAGPPTVWLYGKCETINPLAKKYLPDGGGVSSWNYLEDRPFSSEPGPNTVLFNHTAVEFTNDEYAITEPLPGPLLVGEEYDIVIGGTTYVEMLAEEIESDGTRYIAVGNVDGSHPVSVLFLLYPDNKPDAIGAYGKIVHVKKDVDAAKIKLVGRYEKIKKLDKKYLPDDIAATGGGVCYVVRADDSMITVDESSGNITIMHPRNYDEFAENVYNGAGLQVDMSGTEFASDMSFVRLASMMNMYVPGTGFVSVCCLGGMLVQVVFANGTWTPPTA